MCPFLEVQKSAPWAVGLEACYSRPVMDEPSTLSWHSDRALAYTILRLTMGINIGLRGAVRIANGGGLFVADLLKQFESTPLPTVAVEAFGYTLPWVEATIGLLLVLGWCTRAALVAGGLMMASLTFGTMLVLNYQNAWLQLTYAGMFFLLLVLRSWNVLSLDGWLAGGAGRPVTTSAPGGARSTMAP